MARLEVEITLDADAAHTKRIVCCLELFEDYCIVTASVRQGIDVDVVVLDRDGEPLLAAAQESAQ